MKNKREKTIEYNPVLNPKAAHGYQNVRWVENASCGLRFVGFADEIAKETHSRSIDHKGWFIRDEDYGGEVYRGVVYQVGKLYVYGYADPFNDDCALLCFDVDDHYLSAGANKLYAAQAADRFAEIFAEEERAYSRAFDARTRYDSLADEQKEWRREALDLAAERRAAKRANIEAPTICTVLRSKIFELRQRILEARESQRNLFANFGHEAGWEG